jgi:GNAT superfamily N-acetyltransferase
VIRELSAEDAGAVAALLRRLRNDRLYTEPGVAHRLASAPPRADAAYWVAEDAGGVVAHGYALRRWWRGPDTAHAWVGVAPEARGRGYGSALWALVERHVRELGIASLFSDVVDDPAGEAFLRRRGFRRDRLDRVSAADPRRVDLGELAPRRSRAAADGYRVLTLRELGDIRALYALAMEVSGDMPGSGGGYTFSFEEWEHELLGDPDLHPDASTLVARAGRPVALALVGVAPETRQARNEETGTARAHRRRGLATLAKLETIRWAREHGIESIMTDNAEENRPMLAINERLGYRPLAWRRRWIKELADTAAEPMRDSGP